MTIYFWCLYDTVEGLPRRTKTTTLQGYKDADKVELIKINGDGKRGVFKAEELRGTLRTVFEDGEFVPAKYLKQYAEFRRCGI